MWGKGNDDDLELLVVNCCTCNNWAMEAFEAFLAEHCPGDLALIKVLPKDIKDNGPSVDRQIQPRGADGSQVRRGRSHSLPGR